MKSASSLSEHLSTALYRETRGAGFFRILAGKNGPAYVDVLMALEGACAESPSGISREEALEMIVEMLEHHPGFEFAEEESFVGEAQGGIRDKARAVLEVLLKNHWLEEPPRSDWRRRVQFDAHGAVLLGALRKIAWPDLAVFTDKITAVCAMLADEVELSEHPWQTVENCLSCVREGLNELRAMQKSVQRFTRRQLEEKTLQGNLSVIFDDYSDQMSRSCYASLVRARLPMRLPDAVRRIGDRIADDGALRGVMQQEVMRRQPELTAESAWAQVSEALDELVDLLEKVLPMADEIDRRTADFTRRSLARFRYLQEVTGQRRAELKSFFEKLNSLNAGRRLQRENPRLPDLPSLLLPAVKLPAGLVSLSTPQKRLPSLEQEVFSDAVSDSDRQSGLDEMQRTIREALSVGRANRFVHQLLSHKGDRIESHELRAEGERFASDLIAALLHAETPEARYRLEVQRAEEETSVPAVDDLNEMRVEHFSIIKK